MSNIIKLADGIRGQLIANAQLAEYTSWQLGGPADYVFIPADLADLSLFLRTLDQDIPLTWLGLGSNTLVRSGGIAGVVIITQGALKAISQLDDSLFRAEAGVACAQLARFTARKGFADLEFLAGIPGTMGGALAMNAGCFGGETWQAVAAVEVINRQGEIKQRLPAEYTVAYRHVKKPTDEWFVAGHFKVTPSDKQIVLAKIAELIAHRNRTQPTGLANCGSVFKNPPGDFAGRLIEQAGLKGKRIGGAQVSEKHANFIVNDNQATATDIEELIEIVLTTVYAKTGVRLVPEVCIIGRT